jgi:hypothetical protein
MHMDYFLETYPRAKKNLGRSLRIEIDELTRMCSQNKLCKKILSSLKARIYHKWFPNASVVTWSHVLQSRTLANKTEQFWMCDDFSGEIIQLTDKVS